MNGYQFSLSVTALANTIASELSIEETTLLAAAFVQLGDTLATVATHRAICELKEEKG